MVGQVVLLVVKRVRLIVVFFFCLFDMCIVTTVYTCYGFPMF